MRRVLLLVSSLLIVLALGGVAAWSEMTTSGQVNAVHRADRSELQDTLSGLTGQYMQFTFLSTKSAADATRWRLQPNDARDRAALRALVQTSPLTGYGAAIVSLVGGPLTAYRRSCSKTQSATSADSGVQQRKVYDSRASSGHRQIRQGAAFKGGLYLRCSCIDDCRGSGHFNASQRLLHYQRHVLRDSLI